MHILVLAEQRISNLTNYRDLFLIQECTGKVLSQEVHRFHKFPEFKIHPRSLLNNAIIIPEGFALAGGPFTLAC